MRDGDDSQVLKSDKTTERKSLFLISPIPSEAEMRTTSQLRSGALLRSGLAPISLLRGHDVSLGG